MSAYVPLLRRAIAGDDLSEPEAAGLVGAAMDGSFTPVQVAGILVAIAVKGEFELIEDFASAIPVQVIGNLLDVPMEEREPLRDWSLAILGALEPVISPDVFARGKKPDGTEVVALNVACIDGIELAKLTMTPIDGRNR